MSFKADYGAIEAYRLKVRRSWEDAQEAWSYLDRYCDLPPADRGWLGSLLSSHEAAEQAVGNLLQKLQSVLNSAHGELSGVVNYYRATDEHSAELVDRTYPRAERNTPCPKPK